MSQMIPRLPARLRALAVLPLAASLSMSAACDIALSGAREEATETINRSFPLSAGGTLDIETVNGRIAIEPGTGSTVEVTAVKPATTNGGPPAARAGAKRRRARVTGRRAVPRRRR